METRIAELRKKKGISQEELADALNTSRQAVSKWERGESYPDLDRLKDLATYFNVSIDYLLCYDVEEISVNAFIDKLQESMKNRRTDIDLEQIQRMIATHPNDFRLMCVVILYLHSYWAAKPSVAVADTIIDAAKKGLLLYLPDNDTGFKLQDFHRVIVFAHLMKEDYATARSYIAEHQVTNVKVEDMVCALALGQNEAASSSATELFLRGLVETTNAQLVQACVLIRSNKTVEAYDVIRWTNSYIQSVAKEEDAFLTLRCFLAFLGAICEYRLGLNYDAAVNYCKKNHARSERVSDTSGQLRFYYLAEETDFINLVKSVKEFAKSPLLDSMKGTDVYEDSLTIYRKIFEE